MLASVVSFCLSRLGTKEDVNLEISVGTDPKRPKQAFFPQKVPRKDCFYNTENFQKITMNKKTVAPLSSLSAEDKLETRLLILPVTMFPFFSLGCFERMPSNNLRHHPHLVVWRPPTHTESVMEATWREVMRFPSQSMRTKVISSQEDCWTAWVIIPPSSNDATFLCWQGIYHRRTSNRKLKIHILMT